MCRIVYVEFLGILEIFSKSFQMLGEKMDVIKNFFINYKKARSF